jgi:hypothetical protein
VATGADGVAGAWLMTALKGSDTQPAAFLPSPNKSLVQGWKHSCCIAVVCSIYRITNACSGAGAVMVNVPVAVVQVG